MIKELHKVKAADFIMSRHYSPVMPRLTKHYCGYYVDNVLQGVITFGWGTRPKHTIQKLFPELDTKDYFEIGKMCMDDSMGKNSETQMLSSALRWLKNNKPDLKYLFTWADGLVGKAGYVYQAFNFLYGGYIWTETYVTKKGEKVHPRTIQSQLPNTKNYKYGSRPNPKQLIELELSRVKGKQFRYILPMNKKMRKYLKNSTEKWTINYPKDKDLEWKIKKPGETTYKKTNIMPFNLTKEVEYNQNNINKFKLKNNLDEFFA